MPRYLLLLYADEPAPPEQERRDAELPLWRQLHDSLQEAGLLLGSDRLHPVEAATTVRVRERRDRDPRRPVRGDQGVPGRLLPARVPRPR